MKQSNVVRKPAAIEGSPTNGVPEWMYAYGIQPGEWQHIAKKQLRSMARPNKPLKVQIWAIGMLHTVGYQGELATTMYKGRRVPFTPAHLAIKLQAIAEAYYGEAGIPAAEIQRHRKELRWGRDEIRRALQELEEEGVAERKTKDGSPVRSLPTADRKRLPAGCVLLSFFLQPRPADSEIVKAEWQALVEKPKTDVDKKCLRQPSISLILKVFQIEDAKNSQIKDPLYQNAVTVAWQEAKKVFREKLQDDVDKKCLRHVDTAGPRDVDKSRGAFVRNVEREAEKAKGAAQGSSSSSGDPVEEPSGTTTTTTPHQAEFATQLAQRFREAGKPVPTKRQAAAVEQTLNGRSEAFLAWLTPKKLKPIEHPGALPALAEEFQAWDEAQLSARQKDASQTTAEQIALRSALLWIVHDDPDATPEQRAEAQARLNGLDQAEEESA